MANKIDKMGWIRRRMEELDGVVHKDDFIQAFQEIINHIKKLKENNELVMNKLKKELEKAARGYLDELNKDNLRSVDGMIQEINDKLKTLKDGKDADEEQIVRDVVTRIKLPTAEDILKELPVFGARTRDGLEKLKGDDRLRMSAVRGIKEEFKKLKKKIGGRTQVSVFGGTPHNLVQFSDLTSQCDGVTKSFEVPRHRHAVALMGTQFPVIYRNVTDFTTANKTLTLTSEVSAPETNQTLIFLYVK